MGKDDKDTARCQMRSYWQVYSPSIESMMLSHDAVYLAENEQNEILSYLPKYKGKRVLELGAGIGRYTSKIAPFAKSVTAVDFMDSYIKENEKLNAHHGNVTFMCADVTKLNFPPNSFDLVFSNWLLMYLTEEEAKELCQSVLTWLSPGGHYFIRESCYHQSGNLKLGHNPTKYRVPNEYCGMLLSATHQDKANSDVAQFKIMRGKNILTYIHYHGNPNQLCFLAKKVQCQRSTQSFLDEQQYAMRNIFCYERIFGHMWVSSGGEAKTREICARLGAKPGQRMLDVGCGTGGSAFFMARHYGVHVHGVDLSTNMISIAIDRQGKQEMTVKKKIQFEICDITKVEYDAESFDIIYSRDTVLHIADKLELFEKFFNWLKPGGTLLISDYCRGDKSHSDEFIAYVKQRGYILKTVSEYKRALEKALFKKVVAEDQTREFVSSLKEELKCFMPTKEAFIQDFSAEEYETIVKGWQSKIKRCENGDQAWGLFHATK